MQVDYDYAGNVYVQGGDNMAGQIAKFGPAGNLLWQFAGSASGFTYGTNFGGWAVDKTTGNVYVGQGSTGFGCVIIRLNTSTGLYDNYRTPYFTDGDGNKGEIWKMRWYCNGGSPQLLIAGGSGGVGSFHDNMGVFSLSGTSFISYNVTGITTYPYNQDVSDFVIDPANKDLYCILASGNTPFVNNRIYKNSFPYMAANQRWNTLSGYTVLREDHNTPFMAEPPVINSPGASTNATNILAVNSKYLFYYDGKNLKALDKATGATVGTPQSFGSTALMQQGIYADNCDNVYIGATNGSIKVLRFNGSAFDDNAVADIAIPGYSGKAVYAIEYDADRNYLYAGGDGFIAAVDLASYCASTKPPAVTYTLVANPAGTDVTASLTPALPPGAVVTYTLVSPNGVIGTNSTGTFTNLTSGIDYTMNADIAIECNKAQATAKFKLPDLALELKLTDVCGGKGGKITAIGKGGVPPYMYSIDGINFQSNSEFSNLGKGDYTVTIQDAKGFTVSSPVKIIVNDLAVDAGNDVTICEGTAARLAGNSNGITLLWSPGAGLNNATVANPDASPNATTKYYLSATKGNCTLIDSLIVTVLPAPVADAGNDTSVCYASNGMLHGSGGVSYTWTPGTYLSNEAIAKPRVVYPKQSVTYTLQVTDAHGCHSLQADTMLFHVIPAAEVWAGNDTIVAVGQPLQLQAVDKNQSGFTQYTWSPSYGLLNPLVANPVALLENNGTYQVTALTPEGCTATDAVYVKVFKYVDIYVPNAFTPNGDGHNEIFRITAPGLKTLKYFIIMNRWGQEVFRTTNPAAGWDGTLNGNRQLAGSFVWALEGVDYMGRIFRRRGTVELIR